MGTVVRNNCLRIDDAQKKEDEKLEDPDVQVTARVLKELMDGILEGIEFTTETRQDFQDEWGIPTLDTTWRLVGDKGSRKQIAYRFYKKPVSSRMLTPYRSAQSHNGKVAQLSQEVFRILSNCNEFVTLEERMELLEDNEGI